MKPSQALMVETKKETSLEMVKKKKLAFPSECAGWRPSMLLSVSF